MDINTPLAPGKHELPPLPYHTNALEPVIDAETLTIHHDRHHKKYVDDLNKAELALVEVRAANDYKYIKYWENELAFNGSGHILHSVYWTIMTTPHSGGEPEQYTRAYLDWYFGGTDQFKAQFSAAAVAAEASAWCVLGYNTSWGRLEVLNAGNHQNLTQWGTIPILVCDVWEHAYYLKYQNQRDKYVENWWSVVNWPEVERRFKKAVGGVLPITM